MEEKLTMDDFKEELEASYKAAEESGLSRPFSALLRTRPIRSGGFGRIRAGGGRPRTASDGAGRVPGLSLRLSAHQPGQYGYSQSGGCLGLHRGDP